MMYYDYSFLRLVPAFIWAFAVILGLAMLAWEYVTDDTDVGRARFVLFFGCCFVAAGLPMGKMLYWIATHVIGL